MSVSAAFHMDTVVIGAGVVGLAVARAISGEVVVLDRAEYIGSETSARNSQVVHAGLYYPTDSKKATFCVRGNHLLYDHCEKYNVPMQRIGKLIVASETSQTPRLHDIHQTAQRNGAQTQLLDQNDVKALEPELEVTAALWSPNTGIVDSHQLMESFLVDSNVILSLKTSVDGARIDKENQRIELNIDNSWVSCRRLVNCAGLWADGIASNLHCHTKWRPPRQYYCKGNYFKIHQNPFSHLIYPVPNQSGLGIHATLDVHDSKLVRFGPDTEWLDADIRPDEIDYMVNDKRINDFYSSIRRYWPSVPEELQPDYTGIRPKLQHPSRDAMQFQDFTICGPETHRVPNLFHLFGIESPGLTSSMAIAEHVAAKLDETNFS